LQRDFQKLVDLGGAGKKYVDAHCMGRVECREGLGGAFV
jgi:hypothetical protein